MELIVKSSEVVTAATGKTTETWIAGGSMAVVEFGRYAMVGAWTDGRPGCIDCARLWWQDVSTDTAGQGAPATAAGWRELTDAIASRIAREINETDPSRWNRRVVVIDSLTHEVSEHTFAHHPLCERCDSPSVAPSTLDLATPQPARAGFLRTRSFTGTDLRDRLLDFRFGPVAHVFRDEESPLPLVTCEAVAPGRAERKGGYGRSTSFATSETPAFLEGLERVRGAHRHPGLPVVLGSYTELSEVALNPAELGLHEPACVAHERFPMDRYTPDTQTSWVRGYSTRRRESVLVPEHVAYWHERGASARFLYESSNGCAVGGSLEEATLHGLFEVIERDAFLIAWYGRCRLTEVQLDRSGRFAHVLDLLEERGLRLRILDLTSDFGVPVALSVITAPETHVRAGIAPALCLATGSSLDGERAIATAIEESLTNALMYPKWVRTRPSNDIERCRPMLDDYSLVETLEDHTGLHGLWEARELSAFLTGDPVGVIGQRDFAPDLNDQPADVTAVLRDMLGVVEGRGMDVVMVDQSFPGDPDELGVHSAKVIVPGTIPMTFGHLNRRTVGLPRLHHAATLLRGARPWSDEPTLNVVPHPFP